jgi:hypothetical protein
MPPGNETPHYFGDRADGPDEKRDAFGNPEHPEDAVCPHDGLVVVGNEGERDVAFIGEDLLFLDRIHTHPDDLGPGGLKLT